MEEDADPERELRNTLSYSHRQNFADLVKRRKTEYAAHMFVRLEQTICRQIRISSPTRVMFAVIVR